MDHVLLCHGPPVTSEVATNASWSSCRWVGGPGERAETEDCTVALNNHGHNWAGGHEVDQRLKKRLTFVLFVVFREKLT